MKVIIEIENDSEIEKIRQAFKGEAITVIRAAKDRKGILEEVFNKYNATLPTDYRFDREEIHAR
ncbi:MAG: hypothetical protein HZA20_12000 [Nitrospirae bacterium]|nr:hypothetical protein [Nitrospirota bacterium]